MHEFDRITVDPTVNNGLASIRDTGITVSEVVSRIVKGESFRDVIQIYPSFEYEDIVQALAYAVQNLVQNINMTRFDTNGLFSSVIGYSELLLNMETSPEARQKCLQTLNQNAKAATTCYSNLRTWADFVYLNNAPLYERIAISELEKQVLAGLKRLEKTHKFTLNTKSVDTSLHVRVNYFLREAIAYLMTDLVFDAANLTITQESNQVLFQIHCSDSRQRISSEEYINQVFQSANRVHPVTLAMLIIRQHQSNLKISSYETGILFEFQLPTEPEGIIE